jgi:transposase
MGSKPDKKNEDKSNSELIELKIDNIIQSFQEIDRVVEQLVADNKTSASSLK